MNPTILLIKATISLKIQWRKKILAAHSDDRRNVSSITMLTAFLQEPDDLATNELAGYTDSEIRLAASDVAYHCGFRLFPRSLAQFVELVAKRVAEKRAEINTQIDAVWGRR